MSHFAAVFDACVLHPAELRDFLMWLARARLFRAKWTEKIHEEWTRSIIRRFPESEHKVRRTKLQRTVSLMNSAIPDSLVSGYECLIEGIQLPDPDDRHVFAAAVFAKAEVIVTFNLKDFPAAILKSLHVQAQHPDDFVVSLSDIGIIQTTRRLLLPVTGQRARNGVLSSVCCCVRGPAVRSQGLPAAGRALPVSCEAVPVSSVESLPGRRLSARRRSASACCSSRQSCGPWPCHRRLSARILRARLADQTGNRNGSIP